MNPRRPTTRHVVVKMAEVKDQVTILKETRVTYKGNPIRLSADFSSATLQAEGIFKMLKERNLQPRIIYPASVFRMEGEIVSQTRKLNEFTMKPVV